ncbi:MAG: hypothetical protein KAS04_06885, partial [Candidatus Aenigmarchaeota archaeon]|nr:hypothetical protein [Candidatus Aenigmarchaeota archaeon]
MRARGVVYTLAITIMLFVLFYPIFNALAAGIDSIELVSPANNTWSNQDNDSITFIFNFTGDNASASCVLFIENSTIDIVAVDINTTTKNVTNTDMVSNITIEEGSRFWYVNCTNTTVNQSDIWTLKIDLTKPVITINNPTNNTTNSDVFSFTYIDTSINCSIYSVDGGGNNTNCTIDLDEWSGTLGALSDGQHNITIWANDSAGNTNQTIRYW